MTASHEDHGTLRIARPLAGTRAVFRHELRLFLFSPLTYLFQCGFLAALSVCVFLIADFYSTDEASIRPMLTFLPWVALIMVPALAMRAWADEHGDRAIELVLTLPVSIGAVVLGKFLAGYLVLLVTLLFTLPLVATVYYLGGPDPGVLFAGYVASASILAVYYAISLFAGAFSREQVGAFVLSLTVLFILMILGWDVFERLLHDHLPAGLIDALALYSPNTWLVRLSRGLIDTAGVVYVVAVTSAALAGARMVIRARLVRAGSGIWAPGVWVRTLIGVALLAVLIPLSTRIPGGLDLTAEKEFTLHAGTLKVVSRVPRGTEVTLYWSAGESSVPTAIKSHARRIRDLLDTLAARADGRITVRMIDPAPDTDEELKAQAQGVRRIPMSSGDQFYLGAIFRHGDRVGSIPYFDIRRDRFLEYDIAVALNGLTRERTPRLGVISPLLPSEAALTEREGLSFMAELKRAYDIAVIPYFKKDLPEGLDALLLIDTVVLRREMLYAIDQFVMRGGSLIVMLDPYLRFDRTSNAVNPEPSTEINDISDLLQKYGVRYVGDSVVGDAELASPVADQNQVRMSFPFWMRIGEKGISRSHPVSADLNEVFMVEPGELKLLDPTRAVPLISTTEHSGASPRANFSNELPRELAMDFKPDDRKRVIAAAIRGPFESAFAAPPEGVDDTHYIRRSEAPSVVFAVADVDWLFDPFSLQKVDVGDRVVVRPLNDNLAFLLNMVGYAAGDGALIAIRSRGKLDRPFTRVAKLFRTAEQRFHREEQALTQRVSEIESRITALPGVTKDTKFDQLPVEIKDELSKFQTELLAARRKLRDIRQKIRSEVDLLGQELTIINLASGPLLTLVFAMVVRIQRGRGRHR